MFGDISMSKDAFLANCCSILFSFQLIPAIVAIVMVDVVVVDIAAVTAVATDVVQTGNELEC